jgi:hypothetical protein
MKTEDKIRPHIVTEDGRVVPIRSISVIDLKDAELGIEAEYRERGEPIDPPKYYVEVVGGDKVEHTLTDKNLEVAGNPEETDKRKTLWAAYEIATARMKADQGRTTSEIVMDGIDVELPLDNAWILRKKKRHIRVPEDPDELLTYYKMTEILKTPRDLIVAQQEIILLSSSGTVSRKLVEAASAAFFRKIQDIGEGRTGLAQGDGEEVAGGGVGTQPTPVSD